MPFFLGALRVNTEIKLRFDHLLKSPVPVAQSVTSLTTLTDPGVACSIPAQSHTFVEIDLEN